jgi:hypothetical protein
MDHVQKRPLTGMVSAGISAPRAVATGAGTTLHTLDNTGVQQGGPFVDLVNLWICNPTAGALDFTLTIAGGAAIVVSVGAKSIEKVIEDEVFQTVAGTTSIINGSGSGAGLVFWGDFARIL